MSSSELDTLQSLMRRAQETRNAQVEFVPESERRAYQGESFHAGLDYTVIADKAAYAAWEQIPVCGHSGVVFTVPYCVVEAHKNAVGGIATAA